MVLTLASLTLIAAIVPVVLIGLALLLASKRSIHQGWAMVLVAATAMFLACPTAVFGVVRVRSGFDSFHTSREEFRPNLVWLRNVVIARRYSQHRPRE
jgi:hypothetical protein